MEPGGCICGWRPPHHVRNASRSMVNHMADCKYRQQKAEERRANQKRQISDTDLGDHGGSTSEHTQKTPRLTQVSAGIEAALSAEGYLIFKKVGNLQETPAEEPFESPQHIPSPEPVVPVRRSGRARRFRHPGEDFEATSWTPNPLVPQVNEEVYEQRVDPPVTLHPEALSIPDLSIPSQHRSTLSRFHICRVSSTAPGETIRNILVPNVYTALPHPFRNDTYFEAVKTFCLSPSSKTTGGMDAIAGLITSGKIIPEELMGFKAATELRRLDKFAAESSIAGGPWKTGSVRIKMPCMRSNQPSFTKEEDAPEFEISGIRYRSLVDLLTSKLTNPATLGSFVTTPFAEWWCPPGSTTPIRIYGEAYSSDAAVKMFEEIKGIPPPVDGPQVESVIVLLMLGSDATHLANFGTASLWPLYLFFGNMSKYTSSKPSEFPACHLAYLPKVESIGYTAPGHSDYSISSAA